MKAIFGSLAKALLSGLGAAAMPIAGQSLPFDAPVFSDPAGPPFGRSKNTVARDARAARKRKAKRRARKLGHA